MEKNLNFFENPFDEKSYNLLISFPRNSHI